ncbi:MAG: terpene cyclase/mutase family protein, partial [Lentisphaeria bacterium]|nr:terpene cyclase/mutase family protein [Lentisphaeria bacterium]
DEETEAAVLRALRWLKLTQNPDGSWSRTQPEAMGGLCLLAFLAHGETPTSEEFGMTVQKAIKYLCDRMTAVPENSTKGLSREYTNGIATYALAEAYGVTKLPFIKPAMEKGLRFIVRGQQNSGGFDYNYAKGARWDLSVTGWQVQALKAGFVAGTENGEVPKALEKAASFIKGVSYRDGKFGYNTPGSGSSGIQGVGTLCLQLIGDAESREAKAGAKWIKENATVEWDTKREYAAHSNPVYNWYYQTQVMFHVGRTTWNQWNRQMKPQLVGNLKAGPKTPEGKLTGFWEGPGGKWDRPEYDKWYCTSLNALSLQVYYRYLPTFKMPKQIAKTEKTILDEISIELE